MYAGLAKVAYTVYQINWPCYIIHIELLATLGLIYTAYSSQDKLFPLPVLLMGDPRPEMTLLLPSIF